ncbi:HEAT repeat domain-containing protein [Candidatus Uabimicrobium amorphum]|nr:HEAT repeat domain-containing protein [Candidatus Uabimicrobium amorphum]
MKKVTVVLLMILFMFSVAEDHAQRKNIQVLIKQLNSKKTQLQAIEKLKEMGVEANVALAALKRLANQAFEEENDELFLIAMKAVRTIDTAFLKKDSQPKKQSKRKQTTQKAPIREKTQIKQRTRSVKYTKNLGGINILGSSPDFASKRKYENCHAIVIGINSYDHFTNLQGPNFDAAEIARVLDERYQFQNILLLVDKEPLTRKGNIDTKVGKVSKKLIEDSINELVRAKKIQPKDALFFYYAGHGVPGYLVTSDSKKDPTTGKPIEKTMVSLKKVAKNLESLNARHTLMVLDCCFSGSLLEKEYRPDFSHLTNKAFVDPGGNNLTRVFNRRAFQIITAGAGDEAVADKLDEISTIYAKQFKDSHGHSPFTAVLLQAMQGLTGRDDGIILASQLGFYMTDTLVNDDRIKASQAPRYESLGGNGDFMFFPSHKVLNPKMVAPLYLNGVEFVAFRRSGCEALQNFIDEQSHQDQVSLVKSSLLHVSKLLNDEQRIPRMAALEFVRNMAQKHAHNVSEFSSLVPVLLKLLESRNRLFASKEDHYRVIECLGELHLYADQKFVSVLKRYSNAQEKKWGKYKKDKKLPSVVRQKEDELLKILSTKSKNMQEDANIYWQAIQKYRWLNSTGKEKLNMYANSKNVFLSLAEDVPQRLEAFTLLKDEFTDQEFIDYFEINDENDHVRKEVLSFLGKQNRDLSILFRLLKKSKESTKKQIVKDLEMIGERAFLAIVAELKSDKSESQISKKLLFAFLDWEKSSLFSLVNKLDEKDQSFFIPILAQENFENLYDVLTNINESNDTREKAGDIITRLEKIEPFLAKFFLSIDQRDELDKEEAIDILKYRERKYSTFDVLSYLLKNQNKYVRKAIIEGLSDAGEKAMPLLMSLFADPDWHVRKAAAYSLQKIHSAVPSLIQLLEHPDSNMAQSATVALGYMGEHAHDAVPSLISLLKKQDLDLIKYAAWALENISGQPIQRGFYFGLGLATKLDERRLHLLEENNKEIVEFLIPLLKNQNVDVRKATLHSLSKIRSHLAVPFLVPLLRDQNQVIRKATRKVLEKNTAAFFSFLLTKQSFKARKFAIEILKKDNSYKKFSFKEKSTILSTLEEKTLVFSKPIFIKYLGMVRRDPKMTEMVIWALSKMKTPSLIPLLKSSNSEMRMSVARALGKKGEEAHSAVSFLIRSLNNKDFRMKIAVTWALANIKLPALTPLLKDDDKYVRRAAIWALRNTNAKDCLTVPHLIPLLKDKNARKSAAEALGRIGEKARPAVPHLIHLLKDQDFFVRITVAKTLEKITKTSYSIVPDFISLLEDKNIRKSAVEVLGKIGEKAHPAVPHLIPLLRDNDYDIVGTTVEALGQIGEKAHPAVPHLIPLLRDKNVRKSAVEVLGKIGEKAHPAVPHLIPLLRDKNVRKSATEALGKIGEKAHSAVPFLIPLLKSKNSHVRITAAKTLGKIAETTNSTISFFIPLLEKRDDIGSISGTTNDIINFVVGILKEKINATEIALLTSLLQSPDLRTRMFAICICGELEEKGNFAVEFLIPLLKGNNHEMAGTAAWSLGKIGAFSNLVPLLKDQNNWVRAYTVYALEKIKGRTHAVVPVLIPLLQDPDREVRLQVQEALGNMREKALPPIRNFIRKNKDEVSMKLGIHALNVCLWNAYLYENKNAITNADIDILSKSTDKVILDTVAAIYAWQRNIKKANEYAAMATEKASKRVKLLLEGKSPKQVEDEIK